MTELIQKAIDKIDSEADKIKGTYGQIIASHIIDHNLNCDDNAKKILDEKKSLRACIDNIKKKAQKEAIGNMAIVDDETVYGWVEEYYGFTENESKNENKIIDLFDIL